MAKQSRHEKAMREELLEIGSRIDEQAALLDDLTDQVVGAQQRRDGLLDLRATLERLLGAGAQDEPEAPEGVPF